MIDVMQELILADNPPTQETFQSPSWTLLDLIDLYEIPWDHYYRATFNRAMLGVIKHKELFDQIKIFVGCEIANRSASIVRKAIDPDYGGWDDKEDWDWTSSPDSDPSDNDGYMRDI
jgi:hypothetical protein